jgi:hypothetical protein
MDRDPPFAGMAGVKLHEMTRFMAEAVAHFCRIKEP